MSSETDALIPAKKLVLVDAYSLLFRAFFASRPLTTKDGRPTGALFGFANMLFALLNNEKPDAMIVCWDAHQRTHRRNEYEEYKAHRPDTAPELKAQMPTARELVAAFGIASAEVGGYEADDLIGTLSVKGAQEGYQVEILTGDSDQLQLVGPGVTVQMTQRGVSDVKLYDADAVRERYGVGPERIPDYKALVGDTSDNIPGVPGIGDKTATALLQKWDSLENILEHLSEVTPPKARAALEANIEQAKFSKRLATIVCDVPDDLPIVPYVPTPEIWQNLRELFVELEFKSLLGRIPRFNEDGTAPVIANEEAAPENAFAAQSVRIGNADSLQKALAAVRKAGTLSLIPDADGPAPMRANLRGLAFATDAETGYYVALRVESSDADSGNLGGLFGEADGSEKQSEAETFGAAISDFRAMLEDKAIAKIGHNVKVAEILLERAGIRPTPFAFDSQIAAYLLDASRAAYPLSDLAERHLDLRLDSEDAFSPDALAQQAALVVALVEPMREKLQADNLTEIMETAEMPLIPALAQIEQAGILADAPYLNTLGARMTQEADALAKQVYELAGEEFNIGSTKQLQTILFEKLQLPTGKKIKSGFSTGADLLESLAPKYEIAQKIIDYREVSKLKSTYADALPKLINPQTGRIHTSLNQTVTTTGRLSSSDPNLQNIPVRSHIGREIRQAFIAPPGKVLLSCDYSQIELRLLAHVTGDPALMEAFLADADVHAATAARVFDVPLSEVTPDQRRQAKTINFAVIYGQSGFSLAATLGVDTPTATQWIKDYFENLPGVKRYIDETTALAHQQKYVTTLMGRRRYVPELDSGNHNLRQFAERAAVNMPIQGTAADIMKLAMIRVHAYLQNECEGGCLMLLQVHDELLFEIEEARLAAIAPHIVTRMESAFPLSVRLRADAKVGHNWADMESVR